MLSLTASMKIAEKTIVWEYANTKSWFGHELIAEENKPLRMALNFEVREKIKGTQRTHKKSKGNLQKATLFEKGCFQPQKKGNSGHLRRRGKTPKKIGLIMMIS